MFITLCVIALNEEKTVGKLLSDFEAQDYDKSKLEVLLVDGMSNDGTVRVFEDFKKRNADIFESVTILENPGKTLPCGWNVALKHFRGEAILKVDAHARIPNDFVRLNVETLKGGEDICGGFRPTVLENATKWQQTLLMAENSMFGSSIAPYRQKLEKSYVNSLFHAAYRREIFDKIGGFNENLKRTEDNEIHYRMRKAGYRFCFNPEIKSYQYIRSDLKKMLKQKYGNGYWIGATAKVCPGCLSLYHFVPFAFVCAIAITSIGCAATRWAWIKYLTAIMWGSYGTLALLMAIMAIVGAKKEERSLSNVLLPLLFLLLHVGYGVGTLIGLIKEWPKRC